MCASDKQGPADWLEHDYRKKCEEAQAVRALIAKQEKAMLRRCSQHAASGTLATFPPINVPQSAP